MRVIAGDAKGFRLKAPQSSGVRPTSDMIKGALFSMLEADDISWTRVLDLYAGSGALGIEALSRGAEAADFVEEDHRCCASIKENLERTGLAGRARVYCLPVKKALGLLKGPYSVVFLDPPYSDPSLKGVLTEVASSPLMESRAVLAVEHSFRQPLASGYGPYQLFKNRRHGDTVLDLYRRQPSSSGLPGETTGIGRGC